ncbi:hypothetical protein BJEO58_02590 [Brevibacterium jeotgali]|uniref:DUF559 domain-containing protein n=1 Tax=Brevibacterium jeotgali TaxID=1262550 RepID=A0A2H1L7X0_9MICO|nr:hypothetical protein FB108_2047 [Brevibacterium jeotgali]SMY12982.1 hypothetical protein BJEO58_02590 [Brevibacterium jeotgali]
MMLMYNVITARECALAGIPRTTLVAAQSCCLTRLSRGIFTVTRRCDHHEDFHVAIEDPSVLELRSSLTQRKSVAGSERLRRLEHLSVLDSYRFYRPDDVIGGTSAAIIHGIPLSHRLPPRRTKRTRADATGREFDARLSLGAPGAPVRVEVWNTRRAYTSRWVVRRQAALDATQRARWQGVPVTSAPRTAIDLARIGTALDGLVACDWLLADAAGRRGHDGRLGMRDRLTEAIEECSGLRGVSRARAALASATGLAESVSESLALHRLKEHGLSDVRQQVVIRDSENTAIGRVDFLVEASDSTPVVIEVDGAVKYAGHHLVDAAVEDNPLFREKKREDALRRMGYRVVRLVWADLWDSSRLRTRLREAHIAC